MNISQPAVALDRPVWASLSTHHAGLAEGNALARRFVRDVNLFASASDDSPAALAALAALVRPGESVLILQTPAIVVPPRTHHRQGSQRRAITRASRDALRIRR